MTETCDAIVLGTGGFGSACLYHLARRGVKVVGVDQFPPGHDRGSSHGDTRIIRKAYFEHPDYVPLLLRAYDLWRDLEAESGRSLLTVSGLLLAGPPEGEVVPGCRLAGRLHGVPVEPVPAGEVAARFPAFRIPADFAAVYESDGGILAVEDCVRTHVELAGRHGAGLICGEPVIDWQVTGSTVRVRTAGRELEAAALIITPGAWASRLLAGIPELPPLTVRRKVLLWNPVRSDVCSLENGCPGFLFELPDGVFYGFPSLDGVTLKVAEHSGGEPVADPLTVDRSLRPSDVAPVAGFLQRVLPAVDPQPVRHAVCLYTLTPDGHFLVDRHPVFPNVLFGAGFSGHGFKFTSVIGEALAERVVTGRTSVQLEFLGLSRFRRDDG